MFTALQQFVSDSFAEGALDDLTFGDLQIRVVQGPEVYLACVVRGQAPPNLRRDMRDLLELLVVRLAGELENFQGDLEPFQKSRHLLDGLLVSRRKDEGRKLPPSAFFLPGLLAAVLLGLALHLGYQSRQSRLKAEAEAALQQGYVELEKLIYEETDGPGLYPVHVLRRPDGVWELTFLKDELAEGAEEKLAALGLAPGQVSLNYLPYLSQDRELVERRADLILAGRPETLASSFDWAGQTLTLSGRADLGWVLAAHNALRSLPGVKAVLIKGLVDGETGLTADLDNDKVLRLHGRASIRWLEPLKEKVLTLSGISRLDLGRVEYDAESLRLKELLDRLNGVVIYFPVGQDQPIPENRDLLRQTAEDLVALEKLAGPMGLTVSLTIYGYTDRSGQAKHNYELSQARARALAALLYERGSAITLSTFGLGPDPALDTREEKKAAAQARRRIELKVKLDRSRAALNLD
jgi:outer membrane protein OmpA-like peptidoglycan-associated protein